MTAKDLAKPKNEKTAKHIYFNNNKKRGVRACLIWTLGYCRFEF
jgi:hypothetical protein